MASIYTIAELGAQYTFFEEFLDKVSPSFKDETKSIVQRLHTMGHKTGAKIQFFKLKEGKPGDGVCALYDQPKSNLRLYCIHFGNELIVLGSGGHKSKKIRSLQEDKTLKETNLFMRNLSKIITERLKNKEIIYSNNFFDFSGELEFEINGK